MGLAWASFCCVLVPARTVPAGTGWYWYTRQPAIQGGEPAGQLSDTSTGQYQLAGRLVPILTSRLAGQYWPVFTGTGRPVPASTGTSRLRYGTGTSK